MDRKGIGEIESVDENVFDSEEEIEVRNIRFKMVDHNEFRDNGKEQMVDFGVMCESGSSEDSDYDLYGEPMYKYKDSDETKMK